MRSGQGKWSCHRTHPAPGSAFKLNVVVARNSGQDISRMLVPASLWLAAQYVVCPVAALALNPAIHDLPAPSAPQRRTRLPAKRANGTRGWGNHNPRLVDHVTCECTLCDQPSWCTITNARGRRASARRGGGGCCTGSCCCCQRLARACASLILGRPSHQLPAR
jgi:hypothetical protein